MKSGFRRGSKRIDRKTASLDRAGDELRKLRQQSFLVRAAFLGSRSPHLGDDGVVLAAKRLYPHALFF